MNQQKQWARTTRRHRPAFRRHGIVQIWVLVMSLLMASLACAQDVPSLTDTPDDVVFEYGNPQLKLPSPPRVNTTSLRTVALLADALSRETQVDRRVELLTDLGETQLEVAAPIIRASFTDRAPEVRAAAARAASVLGRQELSEDVSRLMSDESSLVRAEVVMAHGRLSAGRSDASPVVLAAIKDADQAVQLAGLHSARVPAEGQAVTQLVPTLQGRLQLAAVDALGRIGQVASADAVAPLLRGNVSQQLTAARALGAMEATAHASAVHTLLQDDSGQGGSPHPTVRRAALEAMPRLLDGAAAQAIAIQRLDDPDPSVRAVAAAQVAPVPDATVVAKLVQHLSDPYMPLHDAALQALGQPRNDQVKNEVIAQAVTLLDAPAARRREDASRLLGLYRSNAGVEKQIAMLSRENADESVDGGVAQQTVKALGLIGDPRAVEPVRSVAARSVGAVTGDDDVLAAAMASQVFVAAGLLKDREIIPIAKRMMATDPQRSPSEPRGSAAYAVGVVGDPSDQDLINRLMSLQQSIFDAETTKAEAAKAVGRLKAQGPGEQMLSNARNASTPQLRWLSLWAYHRVTGKLEPYVPPEASFRADTAIQDLEP